MKSRLLLALSVSALASVILSPGAMALDPKLEKYDSNAQQAYDGGDYKRAQSQWSKLQTEIGKALAGNPENKSELNNCLEKALRRLGECCLSLKDYNQAADFLNQAKSLAGSDIQDADLDKDLTNLAQVYRLVDLQTLGTEATSALKEVGAEKIVVTKSDAGQHINISLTDKVVKPIDQKGVSEVGFDKTISFDVSQSPDGEIRIDNISGLKVHAAVWVNVIASKLKLNEQREPIAEVTGQKMGISQSVTSKLPDEIYQPVMALVNRVNGIFNEAPTADIASQPIGTAGATTGSAVGGTTDGSGAMAGSGPASTMPSGVGVIVPVVNNGPMGSPSSDNGTENGGMTIPAVNDGPTTPPMQ